MHVQRAARTGELDRSTRGAESSNRITPRPPTWARSLELSLQQNPVENAAKMTALAVPTFPTELTPAPAACGRSRRLAVVDPEPGCVAGSSRSCSVPAFSRFWPISASNAMRSRITQVKFKLVRVTPNDAGPQADAC